MNKIMTIEEKEEKISKIKTQLNEAYTTVDKIRADIKNVELEGIDYTGKFIWIPDYGRMYVTSQRFETQSSNYNDIRIYLNGFGYIINNRKYDDTYNMEVSTTMQWCFPVDEFIKMKKNDIIEISALDFINDFRRDAIDFISSFENKLDSMRPTCEDCKWYKENESCNPEYTNPNFTTNAIEGCFCKK